MRIKIWLILVFCIASLTLSAQMSMVQTQKDDVLLKKYKTFVIVDVATNFVLAKMPVKYDAGANMPKSYFTIDLPEGIASLVPGSVRSFVIHSIQESDEDCVLENNQSERDMFFGRGRFIVNALNKQWLLDIDNETVVFKSKYDGQYLSIEESGDYKPVKEMGQATRWKLYYTY